MIGLVTSKRLNELLVLLCQFILPGGQGQRARRLRRGGRFVEAPASAYATAKVLTNTGSL